MVLITHLEKTMITKKSKPIKKILILSINYLTQIYIILFTSKFMGRNDYNVLKANRM